MSAAVVTLVVEALTQLVPLVISLREQAQNGSPPTPEQEAAIDAALEKAEAAIQAA